jgi:chromosome segregation protein
MYIQSIEIDNFKSFAERARIPFYPGFTAVSGPNGSGKSNIIDAILFCLGLSTSRTMRAEKLTDLINNLSRRREAKVTIVFHKSDDDIAREAESQLKFEMEPFPLDEADPAIAQYDPGRYVMISRRIKDGSSGYTSTYYLNGRPTTLTDVHDYLAQFNILPTCYNVMLQGDVAGLVNMSALERRRIIDEVAGVAEFDRKIDKAQIELTTTAENIERNHLLLQEIEARLAQLAGERDHALKYQKLKDERHGFESIRLQSQYLGLKQALEATQANLAEANVAKRLTRQQLQQLQKTLQDSQAKLTKLAEAVKQKGEDQQIALKKQIEGLKGHIARKQDAIAFGEQKLREHQQDTVKLNDDIKRRQETMVAIQAEVEAIGHQVAELQTRHEQERGHYEALNQELDALAGVTGEAQQARSTIRQALEAAQDTVAQIQRQLLDLEAEQQRLLQGASIQASETEESTQKVALLTAQIAEATERLTAIAEETELLQQRKTRLQGQAAQAQRDYHQAQQALEDAQRQLLRAEAQKVALETVQFSRAVERVLKADIQGVHGTLAQLGTVNDPYGTALEIAMGARVQNLVVDDDAVAEQCIRFLQSQNAGRATFLPLNQIRGQLRGLPRLPGELGVIDYAIHLIDYPTDYDAMFRYALGETLVVEDVGTARRLIRKYRMVTLDGNLFEKTGAITGGSLQKQASGFFQQGQLDDTLGQLRQVFANAQSAKASAQNALNDAELGLQQVQSHLADLKAEAASLQANLWAHQQQLAHWQGILEKAQAATPQGTQSRVAEITQTIAFQQAERARFEVEVAEHQAALAEFEDAMPSQGLEDLRKRLADAKFQMDYVDTQIRNQQTDAKEKQLQISYHQAAIDDYQKRLVEMADQSKAITAERRSHEEEIVVATQQMKELELKTHDLDDELKQLQAERDQMQLVLLDQEKDKHKLERQLAQIDEQVAACTARQRELIPQLDQMKLQLAEAGVDVEQLVAESTTKPLPPIDEVEAAIAKLTRRMEAMEPVNMRAIDEYNQVLDRKTDFAGKIDTLAREREAITMRISGYQDLKRLSFQQAFDSVAGHFKSLYADLADGQGQLRLTQPLEPFTGGLVIEAQPRGKKMQRLESMSGGEKSITSLAFMFALQRHMPASFYALDEVDMNLDGVNAEKLAHMVQRESKKAQFVVVSLRKPMLECSDRIVGVTQKRTGISKVTGIKVHATAPEFPAHELKPIENGMTDVMAGVTDRAEIKEAS